MAEREDQSTLTERELGFIEGAIEGNNSLEAPSKPTSDGASQWFVSMMNALEPREELFSHFRSGQEVLAQFIDQRCPPPPEPQSSKGFDFLFKENKDG